MRRLASALLVAWAAMSASAGTGDAMPGRAGAILDAVRTRVTRQNDAWFDNGDFLPAISSLRVLHGMFPHDYELATDLGWMLENVDDYASAMAVYIDYRKSFPADANASFPEANLYFRLRLFAKVPPLLEPAIRQTPRPGPNTYRLLAGAYERLGYFKDSLRVWDDYLAFAAADRQAKVNRARVARKLDAKPGAPKPGGA